MSDRFVIRWMRRHDDVRFVFKSLWDDAAEGKDRPAWSEHHLRILRMMNRNALASYCDGLWWLTGRGEDRWIALALGCGVAR